MKMAIDVYEYGRRGKCVYMLTYTYAGFRIINMQIEKEDRHMNRIMGITRGPCQRYALHLQEMKKENKKVVVNTKSNPNHAALAPQLERQVEKKAGRAAAMRNALKLPRTIRAGPNKGKEENLGSLYRGFI